MSGMKGETHFFFLFGGNCAETEVRGFVDGGFS